MAVDWGKFDYSKDLEIDFDSLELEAHDCPSLMMKYSEERSRISKSVKLAKENLNVVRSQLINKLLSESAKKPTVAEMDAHVTTSDEYKQAYKELIDLEYEYDLLKDACSSLNVRKEMIQESVRLLGMNYFSRVSLTNGYHKKQEEIAERTTTSSRAAVNRRRRER